MAFRINPLWWPILALVSPIVAPILVARNGRYRDNLARADESNRRRLEWSKPLDLPELEFLELTVLVEWEAEQGFLRDPGVSYLLRTDKGSLLFDVGFGPERPTFAHNAERLGIDFEQTDALAISHLHPDHAGGMRVRRLGQVGWPEKAGAPAGRPCFLPDEAEAPGFSAEVVREPRLLAAGIASTGPLARSLFFLGLTEEQAILARIKSKGLVLLTGCGHMTVELALRMASLISDEPIYAFCGGLHLPITSGRGFYAGVQLQTILGTGKPPWRKVDDDDLDRAIAALKAAAPKKIYLSAHDTCDYAISQIENRIEAETDVLRAGATYRL